MSWTNWGFDGTINEAQWSQMAGLLGNGYVAAGNGDCLATAVGGARSVSVAAGTLYGDGVVSVNSGAETVAMTTPVNGQWYVIALRRTWATNTAALVAIAGATTSTTTPTAPPTSFPTLNTNAGVLTDQPIAWAWCNSANTTVVVYDIRLKAVKSLPPVVANQVERDAKFMTPTQGLQVWRDDLGAVETYFGLYNASTNPGGRDTAGWYMAGRNNGLVMIKPTSITIGGGTATVSATGTVSFTATSYVRLNGVFTSGYKNYKVIFHPVSSAAATDIRARFCAGGTPTTIDYYFEGYQSYATTIAALNGAAQGSFFITQTTSNGWHAGTMEIQNPQVSGLPAVYQLSANGYGSGGMTGYSQHGTLNNGNSYDGFDFVPAGATTLSGFITVYAYN